MPRKKGANNKT